jgi:hypothetical protein
MEYSARIHSRGTGPLLLSARLPRRFAFIFIRPSLVNNFPACRLAEQQMSAKAHIRDHVLSYY